MEISRCQRRCPLCGNKAIPRLLRLCLTVSVIQFLKGPHGLHVFPIIHQRLRRLISILFFFQFQRLPRFLLLCNAVAVIPQRGKGIRCVRVVSFLHQYQRCLISLLCFCCLRTLLNIAENHNPDPTAGKYQCDGNQADHNMVNNRLFLLLFGCILFRRFLFRRLLLRHPLPPLLYRNLLPLLGVVDMNGGFTLKLRGGVDDGRL